MSSDNSDFKKIKKANKGNNEMNGLWKKYNLRWVIVISIWTFILTIIFSFLSEIFLSSTAIIIAFLLLLIIIFIGVISDMLGIAVAAADAKPFHAMAADKVEGSKIAIKLVRNASVVSSFCNDVIGDICGIISGVVGTSIILQLPDGLLISKSMITVVLAGFVASLTVGGKAVGKNIAIRQSQKIVFKAARFLNFLHINIGVDIIPDVNGKK